MKYYFTRLCILLALCVAKVYAQAPTLTSLTPASGPIGTLITLSGTNLSSPTALTIGGVTAIAVSNTGTQLVALVMPGTGTGVASITTAGGGASSSASFTATPSNAPNAQQGSKLVGTGAAGAARQGGSVAVSADGNTAIVGGRFDNSNEGAAWIYTRSGTTWSQQGAKLVGTGAAGAAQQGWSVAMSADGNTAIVGGFADNSNEGAAWVYTRSGGTWSQQGSKLVGTGATGNARQGRGVALSADGNTAIVGGDADNSSLGAAWVYSRSGSTWSQQGSKLVGTGASGAAQQGYSVAVSADGNTAIVGGFGDNTSQGAAWVYTRSGGTWSQQGSKLVGTGAVGNAQQGGSVAVSADGNTAIVSGTSDNSQKGATWVFTRSGSTWSQQGSKLVGTGAVGDANQGQSVAVSADGNTAIVGGIADNSLEGAVWVFTRSGSTWSQQGSKLVGTGAVGAAFQGTSVALSADGNTAIVSGERDNSSQGAVWVYTYVPPPSITSFTPTSGVVGTAVTITGTNFTGATAVSLGGTNQPTFTIVNATTITTTVPVGAGTGIISVTTPGGTASSATVFIVNGQNASAVLGQSVFTTGTANNGGLSASSLSGPQGVAVDPTTGKLFVADASNNRVLRYATAASFTNGAAAEAVLGQTLFTTSTGATSQAGMNGPNGVAFDASGNLYVSDFNNSRVLRFNAASSKANGANADGVLGQASFTSNTAATTQAGMANPTGLTVDNAGNLYVTLGATNRVLRFNGAATKANGANADGVLGQANFTSNAAATTQNGMSFPSRVAVDAVGNLFVSDYSNRRVLRFNGAASKANGANADGVLGQANFTSNAAATTQNGMSGPDGVAVDGGGNLFVVDQNGNNRVLRFDAAASKANGANADGVLGQANFTSSGAATNQSGMNLPVNVAVDGVGNVYVVEVSNNRLLRFNSFLPAAPTITSFTPASGVSGTAVTITGTNFTGANTVRFGSTNQPTYVIVSATSITTTVPTGAGTGFISVTTSGGTAISATVFIVNGQNADAVLGQSNFTSGAVGTTATTMTSALGVAVDPTTGKLFVADQFNHRVLRFASAATFANGEAAEAVLGQTLFTTNATAATQAGMNRPRAVAFDASGNLYVADAQNNRVLRFNAASSKVSGANADGVLGQSSFTTSTAATSAGGMNFPCGVVVDAAGNLFVGDQSNRRVLRFNGAVGKANGANADGVLGQSSFTTSTAATTQAGMNGPQGVAVDAAGNLYVADGGTNRVLRFNGAVGKADGANADGVLGQASFTTSTSATTQAGMNSPLGLAVDAAGNLYVGDEQNSRVLRFNGAASKADGANADGVLGQVNYTSNSQVTTQSGMNRPAGVAVDAVGNLYVADQVNNRVLRYGSAALPVRWLSFTATRLLNKQVELNWQTASEINNARFEVQRGIKSGVFVTIGTVTGNGTTSNISNYTYTDTDAPAQGTLYYRLRQVDFDGAEDYSIVVEVNNDESVNSKWIVYPNPVSTYITLKSDECAPGITFLRVYGSNGQVLLSKATTVEGCILNQAFDVSSLSQGFYVLEIVNSGKAQHLRFVKQ